MLNADDPSLRTNEFACAAVEFRPAAKLLSPSALLPFPNATLCIQIAELENPPATEAYPAIVL